MLDGYALQLEDKNEKATTQMFGNPVSITYNDPIETISGDRTDPMHERTTQITQGLNLTMRFNE